MRIEDYVNAYGLIKLDTELRAGRARLVHSGQRKIVEFGMAPTLTPTPLKPVRQTRLAPVEQEEWMAEAEDFHGE